MSGPCEGAVGAGNGVVSTPVLREIDAKVDQTTKCKLCFRPAREDDKLGPLYEYEVSIIKKISRLNCEFNEGP